MSNKKKIMIVTGEASGDLHGANLVKAMLGIDPTLSFCGMGGEELEKVGVELLFDAKKVSVVGLFEVFSHLKDIREGLRTLKGSLESDPPSLLIIIDLPDFNLILAKKAKQLGIPVFYYICPQVWAWRSGRVRTIAERVDRAGVILPFEQEFMQQRGVDAIYVGHPLLDTVARSYSREEFFTKQNLDQQSVIIGIVPGSRKKEIKELLPIFLESGRLLQEKIRQPLTFLLPLASTISHQDLLDNGVEQFQKELDIRVTTEDRYDVMGSCDAVIAASGTVTLELAILGVPTVVAYRVSPLTYRIARILIKLKHFSLVNLIAEKEVIPELLQHEVTPETIAEKIHDLCTDMSVREVMKLGLLEVQNRLGEQGASLKAARVAIEMLQKADNGETEFYDQQPVEIPINGELDLHHFSPKELKSLIPTYIEECRNNNIYEIRLIHGKGIGNIRRSVHALLERNNNVIRFQLAEEGQGSWGATIAYLKH